MLHNRPPAQRRAVRPRHPHLFVTVNTMPTHLAYMHRELHTGDHLIVVRHGAEYGEVVHRYATDLKLPHWIRCRLSLAAGINLLRYEGHRPDDWWDPGWEIGPVDAELLEDLGEGRLIQRFPHAWLLN